MGHTKRSNWCLADDLAAGFDRPAELLSGFGKPAEGWPILGQTRTIITLRIPIIMGLCMGLMINVSDTA